MLIYSAGQGLIIELVTPVMQFPTCVWENQHFRNLPRYWDTLTLYHTCSKMQTKTILLPFEVSKIAKITTC